MAVITLRGVVNSPTLAKTAMSGRGMEGRGRFALTVRGLPRGRPPVAGGTSPDARGGGSPFVTLPPGLDGRDLLAGGFGLRFKGGDFRREAPRFFLVGGLSYLPVMTA